eukprot:TRINITY_DN5035_c0_g1_i1.p1 TRINITY_DN5035_c0_g1~~TRINITY_DN5035_c0_g1_i1.p1  ORF type:complete len:199 (+),score=41.82 TRINITY_DN5035_c0_g1_i1:85-597(+)
MLRTATTASSSVFAQLWRTTTTTPPPPSCSLGSFYLLLHQRQASTLLAQRKPKENPTGLTREELESLKKELAKDWKVVDATDAVVGSEHGRCQRLQKKWKVSNFLEALEVFRKISKHAEELGHHPDLHLENYNQITVEVYTHTLPGVSENDFILASRIDAELKRLSLIHI